jgi:PAS domain S-box-containing protein
MIKNSKPHTNRAKTESAEGNSLTLVRRKQATAKKRTSEDLTRRLYERTFNSMRIGLYIWRLEAADSLITFRLVAANSATKRFGRPLTKASLGKTLEEINPKLNTEFANVGIDIIRFGRAIALGEFCYTDEHARERFVHVNAFPLPDECIGVTLEDVTERRKLEIALRDSEHCLRAVANSAADAVVSVDSKGRIIFWNRAAGRTFGYRADEAIGKPVSTLLARQSARTHRVKLEQALSFKQPLTMRIFGFVGLRKDQTQFPVEASLSTWKMREKTFLTIIARDVTERKVSEERMAQLNKCFVNLGADPNRNINSLVALCGKLLGGTCALYNRLDQGILFSAGQWNTPLDYHPSSKPDGQVCYDVIRQDRKGVFVIRNLHRTSYVTSDLNVVRYGLKTYVGKAVKFADKAVGSLCALYQNDHIPSEEEERILGLLASAIGVEEERRHMQDELRDNQEKFHAISASALDAIILVDKTGEISYWNPAAETIFGYTKEEATNRRAIELVIPKRFQEKTLNQLRSFKVTGNNSLISKREFTAVRKDGNEFQAELSASALRIKGKLHFLAIIRDISKRKLIENTIRQSEEEYRNASQKLAGLMRSSATMLHTTDLRERLKTIAEAVQEQGWSRVVISLKDENLNTTDVVTAGLRLEEEQYLREHQSTGDVWRKRLSSMFERFRLGEFYYLPWTDPLVRRQFKYALRSKVPKKATVDWDPDDLLFVPLRLPNGLVVGIMSMDDPKDGRRPTQDSLAPLELFAHQAAVAIENARLIQQVKEYAQHLEEKVEERTRDLRKSEGQTRSIFSASPDAITVTDLKGNIVECNEQTLRMHEYASKEELIGQSFLKLIAERDRGKAFENLKRTLEQGHIKNVEYTFVTKVGREFPAELSSSIVTDASHTPLRIVTIAEDITERKRMEQQLFRSERLAAIGELAGMVGHDLRNPLTGIAGATYYLKTKYESELDGKAKEMLNIIRNDIEYSNKIINDLLEYSREARLELAETTPQAIVRDALTLARIPRKIKLIDLTKDKPRITVDVDKLKRAFINMIKNAVDAMPKGGTLTITGERSDGNVKFMFRDTGVGMTRHVASKVFTPLFTTKAKGMGFGLAICKRHVEAHGGSITVQSRLCKGTTFTVTIPVEAKSREDRKVWFNMPDSFPVASTGNKCR